MNSKANTDNPRIAWNCSARVGLVYFTIFCFIAIRLFDFYRCKPEQDQLSRAECRVKTMGKFYPSSPIGYKTQVSEKYVACVLRDVDNWCSCLLGLIIFTDERSLLISVEGVESWSNGGVQHSVLWENHWFFSYFFAKSYAEHPTLGNKTDEYSISEVVVAACLFLPLQVE